MPRTAKPPKPPRARLGSALDLRTPAEIPSGGLHYAAGPVKSITYDGVLVGYLRTERLNGSTLAYCLELFGPRDELSDVDRFPLERPRYPSKSTADRLRRDALRAALDEVTRRCALLSAAGHGLVDDAAMRTGWPVGGVVECVRTQSIAETGATTKLIAWRQLYTVVAVCGPLVWARGAANPQFPEDGPTYHAFWCVSGVSVNYSRLHLVPGVIDAVAAAAARSGVERAHAAVRRVYDVFSPWVSTLRRVNAHQDPADALRAALHAKGALSEEAARELTILCARGAALRAAFAAEMGELAIEAAEIIDGAPPLREGAQ